MQTDEAAKPGGMNRNASDACKPLASNEQVDGDVRVDLLAGLPRREPHADRVLRLRVETGVQERALERRDFSEHVRVDDEVAVCRVRRDGEVGVADAEINPRWRRIRSSCCSLFYATMG